MARKQHIGQDGHIIQLGSAVRVERGLPTASDQPNRWHVYRKVDVKDDPDTTEDERWDEVASYPETEPGEMPAEAMDRAEALADKE
jgi:hypothetical protein